MSWLALFSGYSLNWIIYQPYEHFSLKHWLAFLPHLGTDALCQQPYNQIKRHSLQWWIKQGTQNDFERLMQRVSVVCIRHWRKDTHCNIYWQTFLGKEVWTSERSQGYCCYSQIIIEGECEYFVVQDAANWNKKQMWLLFEGLCCFIYVRNFQGSRR